MIMDGKMIIQKLGCRFSGVEDPFSTSIPPIPLSVRWVSDVCRWVTLVTLLVHRKNYFSIFQYDQTTPKTIRDMKMTLITPYSHQYAYQFWTEVGLNTAFLVKILMIQHTSKHNTLQIVFWLICNSLSNGQLTGASLWLIAQRCKNKSK